MENILAEAFTEKIRMENVICWEENTGTYLGILSEFSEKETKERAARVRKIFETINEQIQNIAQKKDTLCRRMYN